MRCVEREQQLEERDDESANVDPNKKKQPKSLLGNIIKFVLQVFKSHWSFDT